MIKSTLLLFCLLSITLLINGQDFVVSSKISGDEIMIKILPKSLEGFEAYRHDGLSCVVGSIQSSQTTVFDLKPATKTEWENAAASSPRSKAAYEILSKKLPSSSNATFQEIVQANKHLSNSHAFYTILTCSDQIASELSGLSFSIPYQDEKIELNIKNSINSALNATLVINPLKFNYINQSPDIVGFNFDHAVKIGWDHEEYKEQVVAYLIQRKSEDGRFENLDIPPKIYTHQKQDDPLIKYQMLHVDSLEMNYENYSYRIIGLDAWGDKMTPSNEITLHGKDLTPPETPENFKAEYIDQKAQLSWDDPTSDVDRILILRSETGAEGPFEQVNDGFLKNNVNNYSDENIDVEKVYYYLLLAADSAGNVAQTYPEYLNIPDIYPPNPPLDIKAEIDSTGKVILYWHHSENHDIRGYKVFRSDDVKQEYIQISKGTTESNVFYDQLALDNNNPSALYYVKALDHSFNNSIPSDTIEVLRPDTISPSAPILRKAFLENEKINLAWIPSSSKDVKQYLIMADTGNGWWQHSTCPPNVIQQQIQAPSNVQEVSFKVTAMDEVGNKSSNEAGRKIIFPTNNQDEIPFELVVKDGEVTISWMTLGDESQTLIYRTDKNGKPRMLSKVDSKFSSFVDKNVTLGEKYTYTIAKEKPNGLRSGMSVAQEVKAK